MLEPLGIWIDPGWLVKGLVLTALPAFLAGAGIVRGLGRVGFNEVWTFMISMPPLISAWFYFIGWLLDRWRTKHQLTGK
jgi:high-affinity Fe2+/Pb2+ permease